MRAEVEAQEGGCSWLDMDFIRCVQAPSVERARPRIRGSWLGVRSCVLVRSAHGRDRLISRVAGQKRLGLPPVSVAVGHHDVEAPVTAFFLWLDEVESAEIEKVAFDESNFFLCHD